MVNRRQGSASEEIDAPAELISNREHGQRPARRLGHTGLTSFRTASDVFSAIVFHRGHEAGLAFGGEECDQPYPRTGLMLRLPIGRASAGPCLGNVPAPLSALPTANGIEMLGPSQLAPESLRTLESSGLCILPPMSALRLITTNRFRHLVRNHEASVDRTGLVRAEWNGRLSDHTKCVA
jgi:hypothetical protein